MQTFFVTFQVLTLVILLGINAYGAQSKKEDQTVRMNGTQSKLSTDLHFDDLNVNGQRQSPFGATALVEADKKSSRLIDFRTNFDDRIDASEMGR